MILLSSERYFNLTSSLILFFLLIGEASMCNPHRPQPQELPPSSLSDRMSFNTSNVRTKSTCLHTWVNTLKTMTKDRCERYQGNSSPCRTVSLHSLLPSSTPSRSAYSWLVKSRGNHYFQSSTHFWLIKSSGKLPIGLRVAQGRTNHSHLNAPSTSWTRTKPATPG